MRNQYLDRLNRAVDYIAERLDGDVSLERVARAAGFSAFHFHRIFRAQFGETLQEFVTRLRVEKAIFLMRYRPEKKLTDIALDCGFGTSANFSRVFRKRLGVSPRNFDIEEYWRKSKIGKERLFQSPYYLRELTEDEGRGFEVRVAQRPALRIAYVRIYDSFQPEKLPDALETLAGWASKRGLLEQGRWIGMSQDDPEITPLDKYRYDLCLTIPEGVRGEGEVGVRTLAPSLDAVLPVRGDLWEVDRAWNYLFKNWLPRSSYEPTQGPALEVFLQSPLELGWDHYDLEGRVPVRPFRHARGHKK